MIARAQGTQVGKLIVGETVQFFHLRHEPKAAPGSRDSTVLSSFTATIVDVRERLGSVFVDLAISLPGADGYDDEWPIFTIRRSLLVECLQIPNTGALLGICSAEETTTITAMMDGLREALKDMTPPDAIDANVISEALVARSYIDTLTGRLVKHAKEARTTGHLRLVSDPPEATD